MTADLRAVLEGDGDDPKITPADRLRAAELLEHAGGDEPELRTVLRSMSDAGVDAEWDHYFAVELRALLDGRSAEMPRTAAALRGLVEAREERARELGGADRLEGLAEERANRRAEELFQTADVRRSTGAARAPAHDGAPVRTAASASWSRA